MKKFVISLLLALAFTGTAIAQNIEPFNLDAAHHGTTYPVGTQGARMYDDGGADAAYSRGIDYWIILSGTCDTPSVFSIKIETASIAEGDTMFIYDGMGINAPLLMYSTGGEFYPRAVNFYASPSNFAGALTLRLKTAAAGPGVPPPAAGFGILVTCSVPCESITPHLDSIFYKTRNGEIYEFGRIKLLFDVDTHMRYDEQAQDSVIDYIDTLYFDGVNLCQGDGVIFTAHCDYSHTTGWYYPSDSTSYFVWDLANDGDTLEGTALTSIHYTDYWKLACYEMSLHVTDERGCIAATAPSVRVRLAQNPLKTLFTLEDICNSDSLMVNMGYDGDNATLTLKKIDYVDVTTKSNEVRTFIPDGPRCPGDNCYTAEVEFTEFSGGGGGGGGGGGTVTSAGDICSICVNYEHEFMGDYSLALTCPTYQNPAYPPGHGKTVLKLKESVAAGSGHPDGTGAGGGRFTGLPLGGNGHHTYDAMNGGSECDTVSNPYGVGWNYCFSRNSSYTLVNGQLADTPNPANAGMANGPQVTITDYTWPAVPPGFTNSGQVVGPASFPTLDSSDHLNKMNYYTPYDDFSQLIGCPLNGVWKMEVCDNWGSDNGWIFSWSMDICGVSTNSCQYQVDIDSIIWAPDTAAQYHDYDLGHYRGCEIHRKDDLISYILTPDTAGTFPINVTIFDEFGCVWDTNTRITSFWMPQPSLGKDTALCGVFQTELDATDRHAATNNYSYAWHPFGETTPTITTQAWPTGNIDYVTQVTNTNRNGKKCVARDTITINLRRQPTPSFMPTPFTLEGCDPLTLTFNNQTTDGYTYHWEFGDGITSELESPTHTYSEGIYDLKYYVTSIDGCVDSLIYPQTIAVYAAPQAAFSWSPAYPSVTNPVLNLQNLTTPDYPTNKYFWELQYNRNNPLSVETLIDHDPVFNYLDYTTDLNEIPGNYTVRLIARTDNLAPSGNLVYCRDTTENTILVVNDYLTFPSVVTPNGDGINDVFIIGNLIEGMGYPNNSLYIYNRWGTEVYHRENISVYEDFWDPSNVPAGTYFYRFTARGYNGNIEHNGSIEVIK